jgi:molybdenum cofactor biosynthesis enzyme MoaA
VGSVRVRIGLRGYDEPMDSRPTATDFDGRPGMPDRFGRALRDLRISVTDRCNFRCPYCMPREVFGRDYQCLPRDEILSYEEIRRLAAVFVGLGVHKLRITGGEPTVRRGLPDLVAMLAELRTPDGEPADLAMTTNGWRLDEVVPAAEVVEIIDRAWPMEAVDAGYRGEVAERWRYVDGRGEIGLIASVTQPFCGDCTRARLSAEGKLYTCLFSAIGHDLRAPLRGGVTDAELDRLISAIWGARDDRYSERRAAATDRLPKIEMFALGG